jgi:hypothetical protein
VELRQRESDGIVQPAKRPFGLKFKTCEMYLPLD